MDKGGKLHGQKSMANGRNSGKIIQDYGRDNSDYKGSKSVARHGTEGSFGGGVNDVSHSLSGAAANQKAD